MQATLFYQKRGETKGGATAAKKNQATFEHSSAIDTTLESCWEEMPTDEFTD